MWLSLLIVKETVIKFLRFLIFTRQISDSSSQFIKKNTDVF